MLDRQLTEDEDAPYQKLYRLSIPEDANPPVSNNPPQDTVQAMYADSEEVLVSFDPEVMEWYPSVVIPLPQHELFEYLLNELTEELTETVEDEVLRVAGTTDRGSATVWTEPTAKTPAHVATYATEAQRRLTLDAPLPPTDVAETEVREWLLHYVE
jgi:hypothetical protein